MILLEQTTKVGLLLQSTCQVPVTSHRIHARPHVCFT